MTERIQQKRHKGKEVICFDYRGLDEEDEFIEMAEKALEYNLKLNRPTLQLTNITGCYLTPRIMEYINTTMPKVSHLIIKDALIGITGAKRILFQVYNMMVRGNARAFKDEEEALEWLVRD